MPSNRPTYPVDIAGVHRELPIFEVAPGLRIAVLNILGDTELVQASAKALAKKLSHLKYDAIITAEAKSIPLIYALSVETGKKYVVLRKTYKPYMGAALSADSYSITTGAPQMLFLDEKDQDALRGKNIIILDDVISTGSTLSGMRMLMERIDAQVVGEAAIFTEGDDPTVWKHIISLGHLPLFKS
jgi:adenine phosphoribosyltransferase